jgi:hypothetical protein
VIAVATGAAAAALSVSPVRLRLSGAATGTITITNAGDSAATVDARAAGFAVDRRGRPLVAAQRGPAAAWLRLRPARLVLPPRTTVAVAISSAVPARAAPGDHAAVVLFTTRASRTAGVAVRMRIGVVVFVRVAGRVVHRLELGPVKVRRRMLEATVENRGNVVERTRLRITVMRRGHVVARLRSAKRTLLPHSRGTERFHYPPRLEGWVTARIEAGPARRTMRVRL